MLLQTYLLFLLPLLAAAILIWVMTRPYARAGRLLRKSAQLLGRRQYDEALEVYERVDPLRRKMGDAKSQSSVGFEVEQGRGMCWLAKGLFAEAEEHILRAIDFLERGAEQERRIVVFLYSDLAAARFGQGKETEGEAALAEVEKLCAATLDDEAEGIAELLVGAASGAASNNQHDSAFRLARKAVSMLRETPSWRGGQLAEAQISLASIHSVVGEYRQARELVEQAIASTGEGQLDETAQDNALFYLGQLYLIASEFPQAIQYLHKSLALRKRRCGPDDWNTGIVVAGLAGVYRAYGDYERAEQLYRDAYTLQAAQLSADDPILLGTAVQYALLLCDLGKYDEADRLLTTAESVPEDVAKHNWNMLAATRLIRGIWRFDHFQFDRAITCSRDSLQLAQEAYGERHLLTADYAGVLGGMLVRAGRYEQAERVLNETRQTREAAPDASQLDFADLLIVIAEWKLATDRAREAEEVALRAEAMIAGKLLPTNLTLARLHTVLAEALARRGAHAEATDRIRQAEHIRTQIQPPNHPRLVHLCDTAARVCLLAGDEARAERYRIRSRAIRASSEPSA